MPEQGVQIALQPFATREDEVRLTASGVSDRGDVRPFIQTWVIKASTTVCCQSSRQMPRRCSSALTVQTMDDESSPPLKHVPTGTSERKCRATLSSKRERNSAINAAWRTGGVSRSLLTSRCQ